MSESGYNQGVNNQGVTTNLALDKSHICFLIYLTLLYRHEGVLLFIHGLACPGDLSCSMDLTVTVLVVCELAEHMRFMRIEIEKVRIQHEKEREEDRQLHEKDREEDRQLHEKDREEDRQTREKERELSRQQHEKERELSRQQHEKEREKSRQQHEKDREEDRQQHEKEREEDRIRSEADSAKRDRQYHHLNPTPDPRQMEQAADALRPLWPSSVLMGSE